MNKAFTLWAEQDYYRYQDVFPDHAFAHSIIDDLWWCAKFKDLWLGRVQKLREGAGSE